MTTPKTQPADGKGRVHRLVDMVVEEVSLVDRAANKHRFLIVKRSEPTMDETTEPATEETETPEGTPPEAPETATEETEAPEGTPAEAEDPLLTTAVAALESLTGAVELLGEGGADARLAPLAAELRTAAEALLARAGGAPAEGADDKPADDKPADDTAFEDRLAAVRAALEQLSALSAPPPEAPATPPTPTLPEALTAGLTAMTASLRSLAETVKAQQQRLARVEKQFGLPHSTPRTEASDPEDDSEDIGWPMDLNHPMDRESVDKTVSFHDL